MTELPFRYAVDVLDRFPEVRAAVVIARGVVNDVSPSELADDYRATQAEVAATLPGTPPAERPSISAWRGVFSRFGVKPTQHRNAAEALLRRLGRHGDVPSIGPLVDIGNLVSIRHSLPVAAFDLDRFEPPITVTLATGDETFVGIGASDPEPPAPGEVVFSDARGEIAARRWCWKQGAGCATSPATTSAMFVIEAVHTEASDDVQTAGGDLRDLLARHLPAAGVELTFVGAGEVPRPPAD